MGSLTTLSCLSIGLSLDGGPQIILNAPKAKETANVIAIAAHRLMFFIRLALVASLAGYMLPTVSFAMHGDAAATYVKQTPSVDGHAAHSHDDMGMNTVHDHGNQTSDHHSNQSTQDCCSNFCLNMAVVADAPMFSALKASVIRGHTNDLHVFAEPIGFNRPPAFRI